MKRRIEPLDYAVIVVIIITVALCVWSAVDRRARFIRPSAPVITNAAVNALDSRPQKHRPAVPRMRNPRHQIDARLSEQDMAMEEANKAGDHSEVARLLESEAANETPDYERPPDWLVKMRKDNGWTNGVRVTEVPSEP